MNGKTFVEAALKIHAHICLYSSWREFKGQYCPTRPKFERVLSAAPNSLQIIAALALLCVILFPQERERDMEEDKLC